MKPESMRKRRERPVSTYPYPSAVPYPIAINPSIVWSWSRGRGFVNRRRGRHLHRVGTRLWLGHGRRAGDRIRRADPVSYTHLGNGARTNLFMGAEKEPIEPIQALDILLLAAKLDSLQPQSPVFYRGVKVGEVLDCRLSDDARKVLVQARICLLYTSRCV